MRNKPAVMVSTLRVLLLCVPLLLSTACAGDIGLGAAQFANQGIVSQSRRTSAAAEVTALALGVDLATGSAYELPTQVQVILRRIRP